MCPLSGGISSAGPAGAPGTDGVGVPTGGTTGQVLEKASNTNYDTQWATPSGGAAGFRGVFTDADASAPAVNDWWFRINSSVAAVPGTTTDIAIYYNYGASSAYNTLVNIADVGGSYVSGDDAIFGGGTVVSTASLQRTSGTGTTVTIVASGGNFKVQFETNSTLQHMVTALQSWLTANVPNAVLTVTSYGTPELASKLKDLFGIGSPQTVTDTNSGSGSSLTPPSIDLEVITTGGSPPVTEAAYLKIKGTDSTHTFGPV
jgi:hypothetical protein